MNAISNFAGTVAFAADLKKLPHEVYDNMDVLSGIHKRRIYYILDPIEGRGVVTMSPQEIKFFADLLKKQPIDLVREYGCGRSVISLDQATELAQPQGLTLDFVAHAA